MRWGLLTLLLLLTVAALLAAMMVQDRAPKSSTIEIHNGIWLLTEEQLARTKWDDMSQPPPTSQAQALETARALVEYLEKSKDELRLRATKLQSVSLVRIRTEQPSWAYHIFVLGRSNRGGYAQYSLLLMMDGTLAFDPNEFDPKTIQIIQGFDPNKKMEHVGSLSDF